VLVRRGHSSVKYSKFSISKKLFWKRINWSIPLMVSATTLRTSKGVSDNDHVAINNVFWGIAKIWSIEETLSVIPLL
jgi:hypothetical protein